MIVQDQVQGGQRISQATQSIFYSTASIQTQVDFCPITFAQEGLEFLSIEDFFDKCEDVMNTSDTQEESDLNLAVIVGDQPRAQTEKKPKKSKDLKIKEVREVKTL